MPLQQNWKGCLENFKFLCHHPATRHLAVAAPVPQPGSQMLDQNSRITAMGMDILPGDVGNVALVAVLLAIKDNAAFAILPIGAELLGAEIQPELERHVEAGQRWASVTFRSGDIMHTKPALADDVADLVEPVFRTVISFQRTAWNEA